jgi:hypothetical protein
MTTAFIDEQNETSYPVDETSVKMYRILAEHHEIDICLS